VRRENDVKVMGFINGNYNPRTIRVMMKGYDSERRFADGKVC